MTTGGNQGQLSIRKAAWRGLRKNLSEITTVAFVTALLRVAVFLPMLLCVDFGGKLPMWMGWVMAAAVYIGGVIPMRFWGREKMRRLFYSRHLNRRHKKIYQRWLNTGLLRYARGILWGLPFLAGVIYFTVFRRILDYKTFEAPIHWLATLLGGDVSLALGIIFGLMAFFGVLFAYGWWRDLPVEYLPVRSLDTKPTFHWSRRIRKRHGKEMRRNTFANFFLSLPALIGLGAVLTPYVRANVDFSLSADMMVTQLLRLLRTRMPTAEMLKLAAVAAVLYVPFWIFRKTRNAVLMGRLMRENDHGSHSSSHKDVENAAPPVPAKKVDFHAGMGNGEKKETTPAQTAENSDFAQEAARMAQEAAEHAARVAQDAARIAQEAAQNKQGQP